MTSESIHFHRKSKEKKFSYQGFYNMCKGSDFLGIFLCVELAHKKSHV